MVHTMNKSRFALALIGAMVLAVGCKSSGPDKNTTEASSGAEVASVGSQEGDEDLFVSSAVGLSLRKPSSWYFKPTAWSRVNMDDIEFKDDSFGELVRKYATEPLVVVTRYEETTDRLNPIFRVVFRPLGQLKNMSPEDVAKMSVKALPEIYEDFELVGGVESTEVSGYPAAHYVATFTVTNAEGARFPTRSEAWIVKRGAYVFIVGGAGPTEGADESSSEFAQIVRSIAIEPAPE